MAEREIGDIIKDLTKQAMRIAVVWILGMFVFPPFLANIELIPGITASKVVSGIVLLVLGFMVWEILDDMKTLVRYFIHKSRIEPFQDIAEGTSFIVIAVILYFILASVVKNISEPLAGILTIPFAVWVLAYIYKLGRTKEGKLEVKLGK